MKACVCMLEVSRHGLLETELLALLGDKKNIILPEYKELDEDALLSVSVFSFNICYFSFVKWKSVIFAKWDGSKERPRKTSWSFFTKFNKKNFNKSGTFLNGIHLTSITLEWRSNMMLCGHQSNVLCLQWISVLGVTVGVFISLKVNSRCQYNSLTS